MSCDKKVIGKLLSAVFWGKLMSFVEFLGDFFENALFLPKTEFQKISRFHDILCVFIVQFHNSVIVLTAGP